MGGRRCSAVTKRGEPCSAAAVTGSDKCAGHSGLGRLDAAVAAKASAEARRRRAEVRKGGFLALAAEKIEEHADELTDVWLQGARAELPSGGGPDHRTRLAAVADWSGRVYGKPVERVADARESDPLGVGAMSLEQRVALRRELVRAHPELLELVPESERHTL